VDDLHYVLRNHFGISICGANPPTDEYNEKLRTVRECPGIASIDRFAKALFAFMTDEGSDIIASAFSPSKCPMPTAGHAERREMELVRIIFTSPLRM
jgi:hypothetical protein